MSRFATMMEARLLDNQDLYPQTLMGACGIFSKNDMFGGLEGCVASCTPAQKARPARVTRLGRISGDDIICSKRGFMWLCGMLKP